MCLTWTNSYRCIEYNEHVQYIIKAACNVMRIVFMYLDVQIAQHAP